jgi:Tol biopolymer transport system component
LGGLAVLIIVSIAAWWNLRLRPPTSHWQLKSVPLTAAAGWESEPSFSPDGNQAAYVWDEGAGPQFRRHIFVKSIGGGTPLKLTASANEDRSPAWSPNGRSIAFVRVFNSDRGIYTIPALGGAERQVAKGYFAVKDLFTRAISWSPDGRFLAVAESNSPDASTFLSLVNVETGERLRLTTTPDAATSDFNPAFSPDGRRLLFTRCAADCEMYVLSLSQDCRSVGPPSALKQAGQEIKGNVWMPDGKEIVYSLYEADWEASLMKVRAEPGARPERIPFTDELPFSPFSVAVAPRGDRLAYTAILYFVQIWKVEPGKAPESFAPSTRWDVNPQYSPDGKRVVFVSNRSGVVQIWSCDSGGGNPVQITHFDSGFSGTPRWSPDGRSVAFDRRLQHGWGIFVIAADGSQVRKLTSDGSLEQIPSWSADGQWVYYTSNRTGRFEIWKAKANGGKGTQVTSNGGYTAFESADGRSLYYTKEGRPGLWERPVRGGEEKLLLNADVGMEFAVTKDGIYYLPIASKSMRVHRFATGKEDEIALLNVDEAEGLTVSPDRKTILFSAALRHGSNVMIVDNFH